MKKILLLLLLAFSAFAAFFIHKISSDEKSVKGVYSPIAAESPTLTPALTPSPIPLSTPILTPIILKKTSYSIAIFGDSMVDTMGEKLEYLQETLGKKYPQTKFDLYNYGVG